MSRAKFGQSFGRENENGENFLKHVYIGKGFWCHVNIHRATIIVSLANVPRFGNPRATKFPVASIMILVSKLCHDEKLACQ
jgi:hypothetical protein